MNAEVRRKLDMADRVREFNRAHPSEDAVVTSTFAKLEERVTRAGVLATQQLAGVTVERGENERRRKLRRTLHAGELRHLVRVGGLAAKDQPELAKQFKLPRHNAPTRAYLAAARALVSAALVNKEALQALGMPETLPDQLGRMLDQTAEAVDKASAGRREHVGARADLQAGTAEVVDLVGVVDGLNRFRFRTDPEQLAAWESVKNVITRSRNGTTAAPPGGTAADGGLRAA